MTRDQARGGLWGLYKIGSEIVNISCVRNLVSKEVSAAGRGECKDPRYHPSIQHEYLILRLEDRYIIEGSGVQDFCLGILGMEQLQCRLIGSCGSDISLAIGAVGYPKDANLI
jgi:hypothetical protein